MCVAEVQSVVSSSMSVMCIAFVSVGSVRVLFEVCVVCGVCCSSAVCGVW